MTKETLKEAKNFRMQMKWCSIMCWIATLVFIFVPKTNNEDIDWVIIPIGATIFSLIYFKMNAHINEYEKLTEK
jgi:FtsH-binding integral membrane protein